MAMINTNSEYAQSTVKDVKLAKSIIEQLIKEQLTNLDGRLSNLATTNSQLLDEISALKRNYDNLVKDVNSRLEVVHKKLFR